MTHCYVWHDSLPCVTWLIDICDTDTFELVLSLIWFELGLILQLRHILGGFPSYSGWVSCVCWFHWHVSFSCVTWLTATRGDMSGVDSFIRVTWLIPMCDMTHSYTWHDSLLRVVTCEGRCCSFLPLLFASFVWHDVFLRETWLMYALTHSFVWHDWYLCVTWLIHTCDMTRYHVCRDSLLRVVTSERRCCSFLPLFLASCAWQVSFLRMPWLITPHFYVCHDSLLNIVPWRENVAVSCLFFSSRTCDISHFYVCHDASLRIPMCAMTHCETSWQERKMLRFPALFFLPRTCDMSH